MGTRRKQPDSQLVSLKLPRPLMAKVARVAKRRRTTRSAVIRDAIEAYEGGERGSAADRAAHLCGRFGGPRDLATNPKYLKDFGR